MHMIGKLGKAQKVGLTKDFTQIGTCLQLLEISHHWIMPTLFDVWVPTMLTHQLQFSHNKRHENHQHADHYIATLCEELWGAFKETQV